MTSAGGAGRRAKRGDAVPTGKSSATGRAQRGPKQSSAPKSNGVRLVDPAGPAGVRLHALQNTLASLRLRLSILVADPTCRWAQEENLEALQRIAAQAMVQAHDLRQLIDRWRRPRRRQTT